MPRATMPSGEGCLPRALDARLHLGTDERGEFLDHDVGGGLENNGVRSRIHPSLSAHRNLVGIAAHSDITVRVETPAGNGRSWRDRVRRRSWGDNGWSKVHDVLNGDRPIQGRLHAPARTSVSCNQFHLTRGRSLVRSRSAPPTVYLPQRPVLPCGHLAEYLIGVSADRSFAAVASFTSSKCGDLTGGQTLCAR